MQTRAPRSAGQRADSIGAETRALRDLPLLLASLLSPAFVPRGREASRAAVQTLLRPGARGARGAAAPLSALPAAPRALLLSMPPSSPSSAARGACSISLAPFPAGWDPKCSPQHTTAVDIPRVLVRNPVPAAGCAPAAFRFPLHPAGSSWSSSRSRRAWSGCGGVDFGLGCLRAGQRGLRRGWRKPSRSRGDGKRAFQRRPGSLLLLLSCSNRTKLRQTSTKLLRTACARPSTPSRTWRPTCPWPCSFSRASSPWRVPTTWPWRGRTWTSK